MKGSGIKTKKGNSQFSIKNSRITSKRKSPKEPIDTKQLLEKITQNVPLLISIVDLKKDKAVYYNKSTLKSLGYSDEEVKKIINIDIEDHYRLLYHPDDIEKAKNYYSIFENMKDNDIHTNEYRYRHKDGSWQWLKLSAVVFSRDKKGKPQQTLNILENITKQKASDEAIKNSLKEKQVMLREIHHRVKNNLQTISSLLRIESQNIQDEDALRVLKVSQNRVNSMALIHERLYNSKNMSHVDFEDYLNHLASYLMQVYSNPETNIDITINAQQIFLGVDTAIPLGLITNELVSNAFKHAFHNKKEGLIKIDMTYSDKPAIEGNRKIGEYELTVSDNGNGMPKDFNLELASTLGLQLVSMLTKQLAGKLDVKNDNGTTVSIKFEKVKYKESLVD